MTAVAKPIDDRRARMFGQLRQMIMMKDPRHNALRIAGKHPRDVRYAFALTQADFLRAQHHRAAAKVPHRHFKGHAGTQRRLLKNHGQRLVLQNRPIAARLPFHFQAKRKFKQVFQFAGWPACQIEKMLHQSTAAFNTGG